MLIKALNTFSGILDLSSLERLQESNPIEKIHFRHYLRPGNIIEVDDKFYTLTSIQNAIRLGYIEVGNIGVDPNQNKALIDPSYSGTTITKTAGEPLSIGNVVYYKSDSKVYKARANSTSTMICIGIATANVDANALITILIDGIIRNSSVFSFTAGGQASAGQAIVYVSPDISGGVTQNIPDAYPNIIQIIGYAITNDVLAFKPDYTYIETAQCAGSSSSSSSSSS